MNTEKSEEQKTLYTKAWAISSRLSELMCSDAEYEKNYTGSFRSEIKDDFYEKKRKSKGLSITDVAKITGLPRQTISGWYNPKKDNIRIPSNNKLGIIAEKFGVTVSWLLADEKAATKELQANSNTFAEFGIGLQTYLALKGLKDRGVDMEAYLQGVDALFNHFNYPVTNFIPYQNDNDDANGDGEDAELGESIKWVQEKEKEIKDYPAITALRDYFSTEYENRTYLAVPKHLQGKVEKIPLDKRADMLLIGDKRKYTNAFEISPIQLEEMNLNILIGELRKSRARHVAQSFRQYFIGKERCIELELLKSEYRDPYDTNVLTLDVQFEAYKYLTEKGRALYELNKYYNGNE